MTIKNSTELENNNIRKDNKMTEKKEDRKMTELKKVDAKDMRKKIYKENTTLFKIFPKLKQGLLPAEKPVHGWQYKEKDIANWNIYARYLLTAIKSTNLDNFINFMRVLANTRGKLLPIGNFTYLHGIVKDMLLFVKLLQIL